MGKYLFGLMRRMTHNLYSRTRGFLKTLNIAGICPSNLPPFGSLYVNHLSATLPGIWYPFL